MKRVITTVEELQDPIGTIRVTSPLMCYILEKVRTTPNLDSSKTMLLCEKLSYLSGDGKILTIEDKDMIFDIWWAGPTPTPIPIEGNLSVTGNTCPTV